MFKLKLVHRFFSVLPITISMLVLTFSVLTITPGQQARAASIGSSDTPVGLNATDWSQIKSLLLGPAPNLQEAYLKASNTQKNDEFGSSVAISGDTVVVGAPPYGSQAGDSGTVYIFTHNGTTWSQQAALKASNAEDGDAFGTSVAISGDTLVIGSGAEDSRATGVNGDQADNSAPGSGAAYVFIRNGTTWSQQAYLKASNTETHDVFGYPVSISGDTLVVGALGEDSSSSGVNGNQADNSASFSGAAYVFTRTGSDWSQQAYLKASNTDAGDFFGYTVAISGDTLIVGAPGESSAAIGVDGNQADNSADHAGAAYIFTRSGTTWSQQVYIKASNTREESEFGYSLAISDDILAVGADQESSAATGVNGDQSDNSALGSGAVYVFTRAGAAWSQQAYIKASNTGADDSFGTTVAISGDILVVGADRESSSATGVDENQSDNSARNSGAAYVFARSSDTTWNQQAYLKASNTSSGDHFGETVAVSGGVLVVGASMEDSNATGVNGDQSNNLAADSGAAYIFADVPPYLISSVPAGANPTAAASVDFTVRFTKPVIGVDGTDFALATSSAITGAAVTGVSGGPSIYTVSVNTGSGSGSIRLDMFDDDTILDMAAVPLYGPGKGPVDYRNDEPYWVRPLTKTFSSQAANDGWVLESGENTNRGGALNATASTFNLGDDAANRQYRAFLSFSTAALPKHFVIHSALLRIRQCDVPLGTNPFKVLGKLWVDIRKGSFGLVPLQLGDFNATASAPKVAVFNAQPAGGWYSASLSDIGLSYLDTPGLTQFRLYFARDDNNNHKADLMRFLSGNAAGSKPQLVVTYTLP